MLVSLTPLPLALFTSSLGFSWNHFPSTSWSDEEFGTHQCLSYHKPSKKSLAQPLSSSLQLWFTVTCFPALVWLCQQLSSLFKALPTNQLLRFMRQPYLDWLLLAIWMLSGSSSTQFQCSYLCTQSDYYHYRTSLSTKFVALSNQVYDWWQLLWLQLCHCKRARKLILGWVFLHKSC